MKLVWSQRAVSDLKEISDFISDDNPEKAREHVAKLTWRMRQAKKFPYSGRIVPEMRQVGIRELIEGHYRLIYQIAGKIIIVLRVLESHRILKLN